MENNILHINGQEIQPGEFQQIRLHVGRLPSNTRIFINANVYRAEEPGPVCLISGGVHGDEINGVEIVRRAISSGLLASIRRGTVIAIPLLNIYGFINFSRDVPDGKDVNRSFPGYTTGSLASRIAKTVTKKILPHVDFGMDFHTGGGSRHNHPQIRFTKNHEPSKELAKMFQAPFNLPKSAISGSLRKTSVRKEIPMLVFEGGEALRLDGHSIDVGLSGIKRVLYGKGMIEENTPRYYECVEFRKAGWIRAGKGGMFEWTKSSGQYVKSGEPIGYIRSPYGDLEIVVKSKKSGYIIGHNNAPLVHQGDALFNLGYDEQKFV